MHTSTFNIQSEEKQRGYWIAIQVFIVSGSPVFVWFCVWCDYKGFVYTGRKGGAVSERTDCFFIIILSLYTEVLFLEVNFIDLNL